MSIILNFEVDINKPERISKQMCEQMKMSEWSWQLKKVMSEHGHTLSLLQAALIIDSLPHDYNYNEFLQRGFNECYAEVIGECSKD